MNMILDNTEYREDGIFGNLATSTGDPFCVTLQHAYDSGLGNGTYAAKIPPGTYTCQRSMHRLHGMTQDFETFQVMNVPNHTGVLIHWGNFNADSDGCILLGRRIVPNPDNPSANMVTSSRNTFNAFLDLQKGVDTFTLTVNNA